MQPSSLQLFLLCSGYKDDIMPEEAIFHFDPKKEYFTDERCYINELLNDDSDPVISIAQARVEPSVTTQWHKLSDTLERYVITSGEGVMEVGDLPPTLVKAGDVVVIPPMCRQRITNTGKTDLIFLAICSPRFTVDVYHNAEDDK
jgi:mannose-6-phosphate isomerase-like protein (cupin superfamily)